MKKDRKKNKDKEIASVLKATEIPEEVLASDEMKEVSSSSVMNEEVVLPSEDDLIVVDHDPDQTSDDEKSSIDVQTTEFTVTDTVELDGQAETIPNFIMEESTIGSVDPELEQSDREQLLHDEHSNELESTVRLDEQTAHYELSGKQSSAVKINRPKAAVQTVFQTAASYFRWIVHPLETIESVASKNTVPQTVLQLLLQILAIGLLFCAFTAAFTELLSMQATNLVHKRRVIGSLVSIPIHDFIYSINFWYVFIAGLVLGLLIVLLFIILLRLFTFLFRIRITFAKLLSVYASSLLPATLIIIIDCLLFKVLGSNAWGPFVLSVLLILLVFSFFFSIYLLNYSLKKYSDQEFRSMLTVVMTLTMLTFIPLFVTLYGANYLQDALVSSVQSGIRGSFDFIRNLFKFLPFI